MAGQCGNAWSRLENQSPGHTTLNLLHKIRRKMAQHGIKPEEFKDRTIFMSMWSQGEENFKKCVSNSTEV